MCNRLIQCLGVQNGLRLVHTDVTGVNIYSHLVYITYLYLFDVIVQKKH